MNKELIASDNKRFDSDYRVFQVKPNFAADK